MNINKLGYCFGELLRQEISLAYFFFLYKKTKNKNRQIKLIIIIIYLLIFFFYFSANFFSLKSLVNRLTSPASSTSKEAGRFSFQVFSWVFSPFLNRLKTISLK